MKLIRSLGNREILLKTTTRKIGSQEGGFLNFMMMMMIMMMMMMIVMDCFCGMVDRYGMISLISSRDHSQRSSPSRISDMPRTGLEPAQNLSSGLVE